MEKSINFKMKDLIFQVSLRTSHEKEKLSTWFLKFSQYEVTLIV